MKLPLPAFHHLHTLSIYFENIYRTSIFFFLIKEINNKLIAFSIIKIILIKEILDKGVAYF